jgi:hypothetical protein
MLEAADSSSPLYKASVHHLAIIRSFLEGLPADAGVADPHDLAWKWHILIKGAIVAITEGDRDPAARASEIGRSLLDSQPP